ncbi:MAG: chloride channel protein [Chloroflexi bacterium]|nr:chloride channel protein [Chloroflexota bacterium]
MGTGSSTETRSGRERSEASVESHRPAAASVEALGDFLTTPRLVPLCGLAIGIGIVSAFLAWALLRLIGLFTNVFFFQRWSTDLVSPATTQLGWFVIVVPVIGGLIIGFMARYGSERIRGHGIPEALEAILINGSRVEPKVAVLKPLSSAISIGSGGPFGAEGPIIMTGGAIGSLFAQFLHLSSQERKTLLVAGAAGGMSATFDAPIAAALLAVELLLFEWRPRSLIPVALASATAAVVRVYLLGSGPLFPVPPHNPNPELLALVACLGVGAIAGGLSALLTLGVYAAEDGFHHVPLHWMWWPAIGGLVIGIGGLIFPQALGVGYDTLGQLLQGNVAINVILGVLLVKSVIWAVALGSGTSGGVLAPLLMMGAALGGLEAGILPNEGAGFWPLVSMAAILGGTMRSPFTAIVFAVELTHDVQMLLPLLIAVPAAYAFTVLTMRRSILTEKISRRGLHLSREYSVDPLETVFVRDVMRTNVVVLPIDVTVGELSQSLRDDHRGRGQRLYPVVEHDDVLAGVVAASELEMALAETGSGAGERPLADLVRRDPVAAYPDEPLRAVVYRMAKTGVTRMPVIRRGGEVELAGMIGLRDLLQARVRSLEEEQKREQVLRLHRLVPARARRLIRRDVSSRL